MANIPEKVLSDEQSKMSSIYAAMMEELGFSRKDALPLENKNGWNSLVDHQKLASGVKENKLAAQWKNATFDDVDPAELALDSMNNGQSHRERMRANLAASSVVSRRRGDPTPRARGHGIGGGTTGSREGDVARHTQAKFYSPQDAFSHLHGSPPKAAGGISSRNSTPGLPRDSTAAPSRYNLRSQKARDSVPSTLFPKPLPNLSFADKRSITELPIHENISSNGFPRKSGARRGSTLTTKPQRTTSFAFNLAEPEEFMKFVSRKENSENKAPKAKPKSLVNQPQGGRQLHIQHPHMTTKPSTTKIENVTGGEEVKVLHTYECKIEKKFGHERNAHSTIKGRVRIIELNVEQNLAMKLELEDDSGAIIYRKSLGADFKHEIGSSIVSFDSDSAESNGMIKWTLRFAQPWKAPGFSKTVEECKFRLGTTSTVGVVGGKSIQGEQAMFDDHETLISFSDDDYKPKLEITSRYLKDMEEIVEFAEDALDHIENAIEKNGEASFLDQISAIVTSSVASPSENGRVAEGFVGFHIPTTRSGLEVDLSLADSKSELDVTAFPAYGGGLKSSRYSAANHLVKNRLASSITFQSLPKDTAEAYTWAVSRKILDRADQQFNLGLSSNPAAQEQIPPAAPALQAILQNPLNAEYNFEGTVQKALPPTDDESKSLILYPASYLPSDGVSQEFQVPDTTAPSADHGGSAPRYLIKYTIEELMRSRPNACNKIKENLPPGDWVPHSVPRALSKKTFPPLKATVHKIPDGDNQRLLASRRPDNAQYFSSAISLENAKEVRPISAKLAPQTTTSAVNLQDTDLPETKARRGLLNSRFANSPFNNTTISSARESCTERSTTPELGHSTASASITKDHLSTHPPKITTNQSARDPASLTINITAKHDDVAESLKDFIKASGVNYTPKSSLGGLSGSQYASASAVSNGQPRAFPTSSNAIKGRSVMPFQESSDVLDVLINTASLTTTFSKRHDSFSSEDSKDSGVTLNASQVVTQPVTHTWTEQPPSQPFSDHRQRLSTDSSCSNASFATAAEDISIDGEVQFPKLTLDDARLVEGLQADFETLCIEHTQSNISGASEKTVSAADEIPHTSLSTTTHGIQLPTVTREPHPSLSFQGPSKSADLADKNVSTDESQFFSVTSNLDSSLPQDPTSFMTEDQAKEPGVNAGGASIKNSSRVGQPDALVFQPANKLVTTSLIDTVKRRPGLMASRWAQELTHNVKTHVESQAPASSAQPSSGNVTFSAPQPFISHRADRGLAMASSPNNALMPESTTFGSPLYQTIWVPDESKPGQYKEMTGVVKLGGFPAAAQIFPIEPQSMMLSTQAYPSLFGPVVSPQRFVQPPSLISPSGCFTRSPNRSFATHIANNRPTIESGGEHRSQAITPSCIPRSPTRDVQQHIRQRLQESLTRRR